MSFTTHIIAFYGMLAPFVLGAGFLTVAVWLEMKNLKTVKVEDQ